MTTSFAEVAEKLRALHEHDQATRRLEEQIRGGPARLEGAKALVGGIEKRIGALQDRLRVLRAQIKLRENELKAAEQKIERIRAQSSEVKTNREFVAFKAEMTNYQADADRLQGEILKILDVVQQGEEKVAALENDKAGALAKVQASQDELDASLEDVKQKRDTLLQERAGYLEGIPTEPLEAYERARRARGDGIGRLEGEYCGACMEHLTRNDQLSVVNLSRLVRCRGCSRVLLP